MKEIQLTNNERDRLTNENNMWLSTITSKLKPHLVPLWFIFVNSKFYMCTMSSSVKIQNIKNNPKVSVSLQDTFKALIFDCDAKIISKPFPKKVVDAFKLKFDWDISTSENYNVLIELSPYHKIAFNAD